MAPVNSRSVPRMKARNTFWYRSKILASGFRLTKLARYSTLSLRLRNTAPGWGFVSAERLLRPTAAGSGLRTTSLAEQVSISRWLFRRRPAAWTLRSTSDRDLAWRSNSGERFAGCFVDRLNGDHILEPFLARRLRFLTVADALSKMLRLNGELVRLLFGTELINRSSTNLSAYMDAV